MKGYHVPRKAGWDCHGLPVEIAVEKELGFTGKQDIEAYGIAEFNARCRESVLRHVDEFDGDDRADGLLGRHDQRLLDDGPELRRDRLVVAQADLRQGPAGRRTTGSRRTARAAAPALSDHEVAPGLRDRRRPLRLRAVPADLRPARRARRDLLVWTTTPWTLVSNTAVAVHPDGRPTWSRAGRPTSTLVVAEPLLAAVLGEDGRGAATVPGHATLERSAYRRPFDLVDIPEARTTSSSADYVTTEDGTGLVHQAPAFGADDLAVCPRVRPAGGQPGRPGRALPAPTCRWWAACSSRTPTRRSSPTCASAGCCSATSRYEHSYPHCWRCHTAAALLRAARPGTSAPPRSRTSCSPRTSDQLVSRRRSSTAGTATGCSNNVDWALSRHRYWGTPLPIWRCPDEHVTCVGLAGRARRARRAATCPTLDPHRPYVDEVTFACPTCGAEARRVPRGDRRLVRLGLDAVRPVGRARTHNEELRAALPGAVHLRGDRPDPRLVLLADGGRHARVRPVVVRERALPRAHPRRRRPQDEQAPGQHARAGRR